MERIAFARLFATVSGLLLVVLGLFGFLASSEFRNPELTSDLLGLYPVNGWSDSFHLLAGLVGLGLARPLPRLYALLAGIAFTALGIWGILAPNGELLLGALPATRSVNLLNLAIGLLGLLALAASRWDRIGAALAAWWGRRRVGRERRARRRRERRLRRRRRRAAEAARRKREAERKRDPKGKPTPDAKAKAERERTSGRGPKPERASDREPKGERKTDRSPDREPGSGTRRDPKPRD